MIYAGIEIGDGEIKDSYEGYGLIYLESDSIMAAPVKDYDTTAYSEDAGEHIDPRTVMDAFDFKIKFLAQVTPGEKTYPNPNLLRGTQNFENTGGKTWGNNGGVTTDTYKGCRVSYRGNSWSGIYQSFNNVEVGETLTFSAWVKCGYNSGEIRITIPYASNTTTTPVYKVITDEVRDGRWHRVSATFRVDSLSQSVCCRVEAQNNNNPIWVCGHKLERGDVATAYVPHVDEPNYDYYLRHGATDAPRRVNTIIKALNDEMFLADVHSDVLTAQEVTIYDYYKSRKIVGYPQKPLSEPETYHNVAGYQMAVVELALRVSDPKKCDFDYQAKGMGIGRMEIGKDFIIG